MTYKQTMAANKVWPHAGTSSFSPAGFIARLKSAVKFDIPVGYQDETGFHTGVKTAEKEVKWPTEW